MVNEGQGGGGFAGQQGGSGGGFNKNWDGSWDVAATRDAQGWYAEFRIPFSQLRYSGTAGEQTWGIQVTREIARRSEIAAALREIVPGEGVIDALREMRAYETDALTAYRQVDLADNHLVIETDSNPGSIFTNTAGGDLRARFPISLAPPVG